MCNQSLSTMSLITLTHGTTVQLKNLRSPWYELVKPDLVQQIQDAEIELGSCKVAERINARMLEQIASGRLRLSHDQFKFHLCDKASCLQQCQVLERLARLELLELDAVAQIQKMWRGMKGRDVRGEAVWLVYLDATVKIQKMWRGMKGRRDFIQSWFWRGLDRECAQQIQCVWRGVMSRKGKTPNSWWIKPLQTWNKQVCCPHRSMIWIHPPSAGPPL